MLDNPRRGWLGLLILPLVFAWAWIQQWAMLKIENYLPFMGITRSVGLNILLVTTLAILFSIIILIIKLSKEAVLVIVKVDELNVVYRKSGDEIQIPFMSIATYKFFYFKGAASLRFVYNDGSKQMLSSTYYNSRFILMNNYFETAFYRYKYGHDKPVSESSIPPFFKERRATYILIVMAIALGWGALLNDFPDASTSSSFFFIMACLGFVGYAIIWASARKTK